ncbi:MAG: hypothetical protein Q4C04_06925 [Clostridia bacterium]|nr:hypothetical protein [Clostridia bacterium]
MKKKNGTLHDKTSEIRSYVKEHKAVSVVYFILRLLVVFVLVWAAIQGEWERVFTCVLVLFLFMLPSLVQRRFHIELPSMLQIVILVFIFCAEILGELESLFVRVKYWDTILHTTSGFICAAFGYSLVDILNRDNRIRFTLSPFFLALVGFCFSMTISVIWEFFEYGADRLLLVDMQKDTVINTISSVTLDETRSNIPIVIQGITDVAVNGESLGLGGYLDIGLIDTMEDLFVNFIGALVFSIFGFFHARRKDDAKGGLVESIVPSFDEASAARAEQEKAEREALGQNEEPTPEPPYHVNL